VTHRTDDTRTQKENSRAKITNVILVILTIMIVISIITIFTLSSRLSDLQSNYDSINKTASDLCKKYDKNPYLNPFQFFTKWTQTYTMTPQTLDSNTDYTSIIPDDYQKAFTWQAQTGGYGTCQFTLLFPDCTDCQFSVKGELSGSLLPAYNFKSPSSKIGNLMNFNFVLGEFSNIMDVIFALIGDPTQGEKNFTVKTSVICSVFGANSDSKSSSQKDMNIVKVDNLL